jgi:zinc protease
MLPLSIRGAKMSFQKRMVRHLSYLFVTLGVVSLLVNSSFAQTPSTVSGTSEVTKGEITKIQTVEGITEYRLINGLKILLAPDVSDDKVTVNLTYLVGSRHEGYGESGMAHLLEHLIFKGTPSNADPKAEFRRRGFTFNGTTTADRTNYFATFVSNQASLDWYIAWQADAMVNSFIAKRDLDSEMSVVRSEFEIAENNPLQVLSQRMAHAAYTSHAYGKPTVGTRSDIENVDISALQTFYKRYYRPDNAVLVVAGKFDIANTLVAISKSLGRVTKPATPVPQTYTQEAVQDGEHSVVVRRPGPTQVIAAGYHTPAALHPDSAPLTVLVTTLGDTPSGRLHKALVELKIAQGAFAASGAQREAGMAMFGVALAPTEDAAPSQKILLNIVENLAKEPIRQDEFERAKNKIIKSNELGFANAAAVANGAIANEVLGDWRAVFVTRERLKAVTLEDVNRVARTYMLQSNRTFGQMIPTTMPTRAPAAKLVDAAAFLQGYTLSEKGLESVAFDFSTKSLHEKVAFAQTPAGIKTATLFKPVRGDLVTVRVIFKFGNSESLRDKVVAATLAGSMLNMGTSKMTRQQIQDETVRLGASMNFNFGATGGVLSLKVKKENFAAAFEFAMQLLKDSTFPEKEFEEIRSATLKNIEGSIKDKSAQANNAWSRYGNPYAKGDVRYGYALEEWQQAVTTITRKEAYDFYRRFYAATNAEAILLGPIEAKIHQEVIQAALDQWRTSEPWTRIQHPLIDAKPARLILIHPIKRMSAFVHHTACPFPPREWRRRTLP